LPEHLTENQIEYYGQQKLSAEELLPVSDHLGVCAECRGQVEKALGGDAAFFALHSEVFGPAAKAVSSPEMWMHPSIDQISEYVDEMMADEQLQLVKDHLTSCERCVLVVNDLRAFKNQVGPRLNREYRPGSVHARSESWGRRLLAFLPQTLQRPTLAFGSALMVLLLIAIGWMVWQRQQKKGTKPEVVIVTPPTLTPVPTPSLVSTASPLQSSEGDASRVVAQLNDGAGRVVLDTEGKLSGVESLPPAYQRMLKDTLTSQRLAKSPLLAGLNRPGSSLMGGDKQGNTFSVTEPIGKVIVSDRPTFRWSKLEGAAGYVVEVYDEKFNLAAASPQLTDNSWRPSEPLKRGAIYSWQVKAIKDGQEFRSPRPPVMQARFRILDAGKANQLAQAKRAYASSHLMLGLLYAQAGLLEEAEQEFRALQKSNPDSALVKNLLSQINKLRH
jgi:Putative zinc-finger